MKILLRNLKSGTLRLEEVPAPQLQAQGVVVRNHYSLISAGTERAQVQMDKLSLVGKARARPDLVRQVLQKVRTEGLRNTWRAVRSRLESPVPLGYCCAGTVLEAGDMVQGVRAGDLVACSGGGYANHAEVVYVPRNLAVPVPDGLDARVAATAGIGAIALQGIRQCNAKIGETVAVIGLGLIGQLTCQLLLASGCRVIGIDLNKRALEFASGHLPEATLLDASSDSLASAVLDLTDGLGADATIICAATRDSAPINLSAEITREQGIVSAVGLVNLDVPREAYYRKELKLVVSRSLGPGRYDPSYEEHGLDYPPAYVRWTEGRNMAAYLQLAADGAIDPGALITHEFDFENALDAYELISSEGKDFYVGVLLRYDTQKKHLRQAVIIPGKSKHRFEGAPGVGLIGPGSYASKFLLPYLKRARLRGVASGSGHKARAAAERFGFDFVAADPTQVIEDQDTDVVIIATRHNLHAGLVVAALEAGKAVFVEKPLCLTIDELRRIIAARSEDSFLHVGFNRRFAPAVGVAVKHIHGLGPRLMLSRINAGPLQGHWLQDPTQGGGRIIGEGCHFIDLLRFFAGSPVVRISSSAVRRGGSSAVESEDVSITMEYRDGTIGTVLYTGSGSTTQTKERYELFAAGTSAVINDFREVELYGRTRERIRMRRRDTGQEEQMRRFLLGLKEGRPPILMDELVEVALATLAAVESISRSAPVEMAEMWQLLEAEE